MEFGEISRQGHLWPYEQVAAVISEAIRSGEIAPGQRLPAQNRLAQMAGVSKSTVQNALTVLHDQGLVYSVPRLGIFAAEREAEPPGG